MKEYTTMYLVKSEDLNHHGTLFAARTASWFVEAAFVAAACTHKNPGEILCRNVHGMSFTTPVQCGDIVRIVSRVAYAGKTSMTVSVRVFSELGDKLAVEGFLSFVTVKEETREKIVHGIVLDEPADEDEVEIRKQAKKLRTGV